MRRMNEQGGRASGRNQFSEMIFFGALLSLSVSPFHPRSLRGRMRNEWSGHGRGRQQAGRPAQIETKDTEAHRGKSDAAD